MKLSIIIPNLNGEKSIEKTILSAMKSCSGIENEIIVVDDFSTDDSCRIVKKISRRFRNVRLLMNKNRMGAAFCRNLGIAKARGKVLLFIDNDVFLRGGSGAKLFRSAEGKNRIAFPKLVFHNGRVMWPISSKEESFLGVSACFAARKEVFRRVGLFDENYETYLEDADFFLRCRMAGIKFCYEKGALAVHSVPQFYNAERRYFLENRNLVYGILKFRQLRASEREPFNLSSLFRNFACGLFNFRWFDWSHYDRTIDKKDKIRLLFWKHKPISVIPGFLLCFVFFAGAFSGLFAYAFRRNS